jgi:hypothetical protein
MTTETLMTTEAATTTEGDAASQQAATTATVADQGGQQQQATEGQTTESQPADGAQAEGDAGATQGAPEKYEFKAPEGQVFDAKVIGAFSEVAKELNLSNESAQKVLDKVAPALAEKQAELVETAKAEWVETAKADKEFGGTKLDENLALAKKALDTFGSPELRTLLNDSGLGNHPEIIRAFYRAGKAISEDSFVSGTRGTSETKSIAQRMYPNMNP